MAIINNAHPGSQINLLCLIYRVLRRAKSSITVDNITELCRPDNLLRKKDHVKRFSGELRFWASENHQLWSIDEENTLEISHKTQSETPSPIEIGNIVRRVLFLRTIDDIMKKENKYDIESLLRTLACLLASGRFLPLGKELMDKQGLDTLLDELLLPQHSLNDSEKPTLLEYGHFLGLFELQERGYIVDPTRAVFSYLPEIFCDEKNMKIKDFIGKLSDYVPIMDGGEYQRQVIPIMIEKGWKQGQEENISLVLSHALERLRMDKIVRLEAISDDSQAMQLQLPRSQSRPVSRISFIGRQE